MPESSSPSRRARLIVLVLAGASFVASFAIAGWLFPHLSANNDEAVYVFQAKTLEHGSLTLPAEPHADFFRPWMSGPRDGRQVLVFQPVFPATLALSDLVFGTMRVAPAAITAGCVLVMFAFARTAFGNERLALLAAGVMAFSPLTLVHSGLYLEYLYAVLLELAVLVLVLRARTDHRVARLVGAGLLHGLLFFMRPLDAILLGGVVVALQFGPPRAGWRQGLREVGTVAAAAVPGVALCLAYNHVVTGHVLRFPLWAIGGKNDLGFGTRYIAAGAPQIHFGWNDASIAIRQNLRSFPHWLAGGVVAVPVGAYGLWQLRRTRAFAALVAIAVLFPIGYLAYWGNVLIVFGRRTIGPHYYLALLIPGAIAVAAGVDAVARRGRAALGAVAVALAAATIIELPDKIDRNDATAARIDREDAAIEAATANGEAIVVLPITSDGPYVMHPRGWLMNEPDLSNRVRFAADRGGENVELFDRFPGTAIWRFQSVTGRDGEERPDMRRIAGLRLDAERTVAVTVRNTDRRPVVVARLGVDRTSAGTCTLAADAAPDQVFTLELALRAGQVTLRCPDRTLLTATLPDATGTIAVGAAFGPSDDAGFADIHEYRVWFRHRGATTDVVTPAEQWHRTPSPAFRWRVTDADPAIELSLG